MATIDELQKENATLRKAYKAAQDTVIEQTHLIIAMLYTYGPEVTIIIQNFEEYFKDSNYAVMTSVDEHGVYTAKCKLNLTGEGEAA